MVARSQIVKASSYLVIVVFMGLRISKVVFFFFHVNSTFPTLPETSQSGLEISKQLEILDISVNNFPVRHRVLSGVVFVGLGRDEYSNWLRAKQDLVSIRTILCNCYIVCNIFNQYVDVMIKIYGRKLKFSKKHYILHHMN
ncbi:hypothetical protein L1887_34780 [Cichorium endivia]|nr:hypothetical protein L1887_34780 [Cichorium endivia]